MPVHLFPIHYSVSSNKDVFELIKVDIIRELFAKNVLVIKPPVRDKNTSSAVIDFAKKHPLRLSSLILKVASHLHPYGGVISGITDSVYELIKAVGEYEAQYNEELMTNEEKLDEYSIDFFNRPGTYLEFDHISYLISSSLKQDKRQKVLIIDDLDRLDPEHIFRIMNVFAAHSNMDGGLSKFGFDKVVFVAHYQNLQSIFKHRYGAETDFKGYMSKFFSANIFEFDFNRVFVSRIALYLKNISLSEDEKVVFVDLCRFFIGLKLITIRDVEKLVNVPLSYSDNEFFIVSQRFLNANSSAYISSSLERAFIAIDDLPWLKLLKMFLVVFGKTSDLEIALTTFKKLYRFGNDVVAQAFIRIFALSHRTVCLLDRYPAIYKNLDDIQAFNATSSGFHFRYFNLVIVCRVNWHRNNQYAGQCSYFKGAEITFQYVPSQFDQDQFNEAVLNSSRSMLSPDYGTSQNYL